MGVRQRFAEWWRAYNSRRALGESYREVAEKAVEELAAPERWMIVTYLAEEDKFRDHGQLVLPWCRDRDFERVLADALGWTGEDQGELGMTREEFLDGFSWEVLELRCAGLELGTRGGAGPFRRRLKWVEPPR